MNGLRFQKHISLVLALLMLLPALAFETVAQEQEGEASAMADRNPV